MVLYCTVCTQLIQDSIYCQYKNCVLLKSSAVFYEALKHTQFTKMTFWQAGNSRRFVGKISFLKIFFLSLFLTYCTANLGLVFFTLFVQYSQGDLPPSVRPVQRPPGPRFEPAGWADLVAGNLITIQYSTQTTPTSKNKK